MTQPDLTCSSPPHWRVAVIGSGPAGFYAVGELLKQQEMPVKVDLFDRLPTPYGLVRGGLLRIIRKSKQSVKSLTGLQARNISAISEMSNLEGI